MVAKGSCVSGTKTSVIVLGWEFSRHGGVQEVSRQVAETLGRSTAFDARVVRYPRIEKFAAALRAWLARTAGRDTACVFMHPHIFQECAGLFSDVDAPATVVWAYGSDVWGEFGRRYGSALPKATKVVAISGYTAARVRENFPEADVSVIRLAVEDPPTAARDGGPGFEIVTVARLAGDEEAKGHDLVLQALGLLAERGLRIPYHVVGTGPDQPRLVRLARDLGLADRVVFHGYVPDDEKECIYARSAAFVMPSRIVRRDRAPWSGEGFGLVYLEAALRGLPVIACDEGGQVECVIDGTTGFLVRPDPEMIADRIARLAVDPEERRRLGEGGREFVRRRFTPEQFTADLERIISEAVWKRAGRAGSPTVAAAHWPAAGGPPPDRPADVRHTAASPPGDASDSPIGRDECIALARAQDRGPTAAIPPIIHQIWLGGPMPPAIREMVDTFARDYLRAYPGFRHVLWDDEALKRLPMANRDLFDREPAADCKSDIARLEILARHGGVYVDADVVWLGRGSLLDLEYLGSHGLLIASEKAGDAIGSGYLDAHTTRSANTVLGSTAGNPIVRFMRSRLRWSYLRHRGYGVVAATGPDFVQTCLGSLEPDIRVRILGHEHFYPCWWCADPDRNPGHAEWLDAVRSSPAELARRYPGAILFHRGGSAPDRSGTS